jgi:hypothetical protein
VGTGKQQRKGRRKKRKRKGSKENGRRKCWRNSGVGNLMRLDKGSRNMNERKRIGMKEEDGSIGGHREEEEGCKGNKIQKE